MDWVKYYDVLGNSTDPGKGNFKKRRRASKGQGTQARSLSSLAYNCT